MSVAEEFADGRASREELERAFQDAQEAVPAAPDIKAKNALRAAAWCANPEVDALGVARAVGWGATYAAVGPEAAERSAQAALLRDVFGNPVQ